MPDSYLTPFDVPSCVFASYIVQALEKTSPSKEDYHEKIRLGNEFLSNLPPYEKPFYEKDNPEPFAIDIYSLPHAILDHFVRNCYADYPEVYDQFREDFISDVIHYNDWSSKVVLDE